jgi:hypothetical protein
VYLPAAGWVDFDPANAIVGNRDLILSRSRDVAISTIFGPASLAEFTVVTDEVTPPV